MSSALSAPVDAFQIFRNTKTFGSLNGFRGIAVIMVIWHHTSAKYYPDIRFLGMGYLGVELFFVISGFLITTLLLREKAKTGDISLKDFYMRRSLRIFPIYYAILLVYIAAVLLFDRNTPAGIDFMGNLKYFLTYTSNWFVPLDQPRVIFYFAWSLATEEQFYVMWPSVEKFFSEKWAILTAVGLIAISTLAGMGLFAFIFPLESLPTTILKNIAVAIVLGVLFAHVLHHRKSFNIAYKILGHPWSCVIALAGLFLAMFLPAKLTVMNYNLVFLMMLFLIGSCVIREDHWFAKPLAWKPIALVGLLSYGIYLMHMLCYNTVKQLCSLASVSYKYLAFPLTTLLVVGAAWVSYTYFESYFLRLKERFSRV